VEKDRLFELADLVLAIARQINASREYPAEAWTPVESAAMRFIDRNPGATARQVAEATRTVSSNLSRALRNLEQRGLVRRVSDSHDARRVRVFPTERARENLALLHDVWGRMLEGTVDDGDELESTIQTLRRVESGLSRRPR